MNAPGTSDRNPVWQQISHSMLVLIVLGWAAVTTAGAARADDDDDDDDDDSTSSSVISTWPPTTVEWPPKLEGAGDAASARQPPIVVPNGLPLPSPTVVASPIQPIVPVTIAAAPEVIPP